MIEADKSKSKSGKKRSKAPWAKLLSQYPQVCMLFACFALAADNAH